MYSQNRKLKKSKAFKNPKLHKKSNCIIGSSEHSLFRLTNKKGIELQRFACSKCSGYIPVSQCPHYAKDFNNLDGLCNLCGSDI